LGKTHVTLCNMSATARAEIAGELQGKRVRKLSGRVLTAAEMNAHNTFSQPQSVKTVSFDACKVTDQGFAATLPAKSVVVIELE
jgi:alpha-N-arabinofuranosidase